MRLSRDRRGRLTLPDLLFALAAFAFLGALWPVVADSLETSVQYMTTGEVYLVRLLLPLAILTMLSLIYVKAAGGARQ